MKIFTEGKNTTVSNVYINFLEANSRNLPAIPFQNLLQKVKGLCS